MPRQSTSAEPPRLGFCTCRLSSAALELTTLPSLLNYHLTSARSSTFLASPSVELQNLTFRTTVLTTPVTDFQKIVTWPVCAACTPNNLLTGRSHEEPIAHRKQLCQSHVRHRRHEGQGTKPWEGQRAMDGVGGRKVQDSWSCNTTYISGKVQDSARA